MSFKVFSNDPDRMPGDIYTVPKSGPDALYIFISIAVMLTFLLEAESIHERNVRVLDTYDMLLGSLRRRDEQSAPNPTSDIQHTPEQLAKHQKYHDEYLARRANPPELSNAPWVFLTLFAIKLSFFIWNIVRFRKRRELANQIKTAEG